MTIIRLFMQLLRQIRQWDRPSQIALILSAALLLIVGGLALFGPQEVRQAAAFGAVGLAIVSQLIVMWGNRGMVTPYTRAQRHFVAGEFDQARDLLEQERRSASPNADVLTLLGNTYRQLGDLQISETTLCEALILKPDYHFPLYGLGRTLMEAGRYDEASQMIEQALRAGAPPVIRFDLGHVYYRQGKFAEARRSFEEAKDFAKEPYRELMIAYLLYKMDSGEFPSANLIESGLPVWLASARRVQHTPFGQALLQDVGALQSFVYNPNTQSAIE